MDTNEYRISSVLCSKKEEEMKTFEFIVCCLLALCVFFGILYVNNYATYKPKSMIHVNTSVIRPNQRITICSGNDTLIIQSPKGGYLRRKIIYTFNENK